MLDKIIFGNSFRNGDIHVSRAFIRDIKKKIPAGEYIYQQSDMSCLDVLRDIDGLKTVKGLTFDINRGIFIENNILYIGTWYACLNYKYFIDGCSIVTLYNYFRNELNKTMGNEVISNNILDYLPYIDYTRINQVADYKINEFSSDGKMTILLCDNQPSSGQGIHVNFNDFHQLIKENPNIKFVSTNAAVVKCSPNVFYFSDIWNSNGNFNLNEIAYLSEKCRFLIGRSSGPHTFSFTKDNILNKTKTYILYLNLPIYDFGISKLNSEKCNVYNFTHDSIPHIREMIKNV